MSNLSDFRQLNDSELVRLTLLDRDNFLYIVERYRNQLLRYIKRITNVRPEEAEDLLQDIFIKIYLNLNDFDGDLKFSSWIYRIAHNQVISNFRKIKARPEGHAINLEDAVSSRLLSDIDINRTVDQSLLKKKMAQVFSSISPKYKEVLVLRFFEEQSYQEISDIIKKPVGTVASLINQAKKELKTLLVE